ncbi:MAG: TonB-dependent receptor plug domain-containing protein [Bacteroidota bacterium]
MKLFGSSKDITYPWLSYCFKQSKLLRLMKITAFLLTVFSLQVSAKGHAQTITLSLKNEPIQKAFKQIESQAGYTFIYTKNMIANSKPVTFVAKDETLEKVLKLCFNDQPFVYTIMDKYIVIKQKSIPAVNDVEGAGSTLSNFELHGRVNDESGKPVVRSTVTEKGTKNIAFTNDDGEFVLTNVSENAIIVISNVGFVTQELKLNDTKYLDVQLKFLVSAIEGVTISTGYQEIAKERATGSFEKIDNKLFNRSVSTNILPRLEGVTAGVVFNRKIGVNGNPNDFSIRGISTLGSDQRPLIVVDNFPYEGDINNINPNDVENITILKDAAAASIWGARAGNGVVVITTKKGKYLQKANVSINTNITIVDKPDLFYIPQFPASDFINLESFLFGKGFYNSQLNNTSNRPILTPAVEIFAKSRAGLITPGDSISQIDALKNIDIRNDYSKYLLQKAINQQYNINVTGGKDDINYLLSVGYDKNLDNLVGNKQDRITIRLQNNIKPIKNLELQIGVLYTQNNTQTNSTGVPVSNGKSSLYPYAKLADQNGNPLAIEKDYRGSFTDTAGHGNLLDWKYRPIEEISLADNTFKVQDILLNFGANYRFTSYLSGDVKYQYEKQNGVTRNYYSPSTYYARNLINLYTPTGGIATVNSAIPYGGILDLMDANLISNSFRGQLNFNRLVSRKHDINAIAGAEIRETKSTSNRNRTYGYDDDVITFRDVDYLTSFTPYSDLGYSQRIPSNILFGDNTNRFVSYYANASYTYDKRYIFSASARRDASNLFGVETNNKWKPLWSVGAGWNISNEAFYESTLLPY